MIRNQQSRFSKIPTDVQMRRTKFPFGSSNGWDHKFTGNAGKLIPFFVHEILPGDSLSINTAFVCRMATPIFPVMDDAFAETFYFFVPSRLLWTHFEEFYGENKTTYWTQPVEYQMPQISVPVGDPEEPESFQPISGFEVGSVADYMGLPVSDGVVAYTGDNTGPRFYNALPFRAYVKIFNDWFRSEVVQSPAYFYDGDSAVTGKRLDPNDDGTLTALYGGNLLPIGKFFDYFTSATPQPQKGDPTMIPVSGILNNVMTPVVTEATDHDGKGSNGSLNRLKIGYSGSSIDTNVRVLWGSRIDGGKMNVGAYDSGVASSEISDSRSVWPTNLWTRATEIDTSPLGVLVNDVRMAFGIQRVLERWARYGSRMIESIQAFFGVTSPDARLQRSEYLGGDRRRIDMQQVTQTSSTDSTSPLGTTSAYSLTLSVHHDFDKSFVEPGYVIGIMAVRTRHSYQFATEKFWRKRRFFDYYLPQLANIGDQPIMASEIFDNGIAEIVDGTDQDTVFGFNEAWSDYRYKPNRISGYMRSHISGSLDAWHYADNPYVNYSDAPPIINSGFIKETAANIDRTLAVPSETSHQFLFDVKIKGSIVRVMPAHSFPGLVDHF